MTTVAVVTVVVVEEEEMVEEVEDEGKQSFMLCDISKQIPNLSY